MHRPSAPLSPWDPSDLPALLTLDDLGDDRFRSRHGDANRNGRAYGGQVLGQATRAAAMTVEPTRAATLLQFLFLQGTDPERSVDFEVRRLQDGKRFSSRHIRGVQDGRLVLDAHATFAPALRSPEHAEPIGATAMPPGECAKLPRLPDEWDEGLGKLGGYSTLEKPCLEFHVPEPERQIDPQHADTRLRFWIRTRRALPDDASLRTAAFAYLSDWWLNFSSLASHVRDLASDERLYVSSLNHCIWFHQPIRPDAWLHFDSRSPFAGDGRGLSIAGVHDLEGRRVATVTQECLMAYA